MLDALAAERASTIRNRMAAYGGATLFVLLCVAFLCWRTLSSISGLIRDIANRMRGLAEGDKTSAFRCSSGPTCSAISRGRSRSSAARRSATMNSRPPPRRSAPRRNEQRVDAQARAEREAEARLNQATASLAAGLRKLAAGDLLCEINEAFAPQFEALRADFNSSVKTLRETLISVGGGAGTVGGRSVEVSSAANNLSRLTEQTAASLEQTSAAMEEITSNVSSTSKRAGETRDTVRDTRARAENADKVMREATEAMRRIETSSKQIANINNVIDEIAFQTNLLALNAGVEAARAGEAGKGFAVVAQEVRELALRCSGAAKEIGELIGNSAVSVGDGARLVNVTGEELRAIAELIQRVDENVDAIANGAREQSTALSEVSTAVVEMDKATQQNAAMVEEMNAAGGALAEESRQLNALIAHFRVSHASARRDGRAAPAAA